MDNSNIYDMKLFRNKFKKIYHENKYNFPINDNRLNNIYHHRKNLQIIFIKKQFYRMRLTMRKNIY